MSTHMTHEPPYGIIYGAEGYDFPLIAEDGPYETLDEARASLNSDTAARLGGWMIVSGWIASDGASITTGAGMVVESDLDAQVEG